MRFKLASILVLTAVMGALVLLHVEHINGPWYWLWAWRRLNAWIYPAMLLAAAPFALAQYLWIRRAQRAALACLFAATLLLMLTAIAFQPPTCLRRLTAIVENSINTSYFTDAVILHKQQNISVADWLYQYPDIIPLLHLHSRYKPPGPILFYVALVSLLGSGAAAATAGGIIVALLASAAPLVVYKMCLIYDGEADGAFAAASYLALCPSLILFLPQFDQVYVLFSSILLSLYGVAMLRSRRWILASCAMGAILALALFMSYIVLMLGFFFVAFALVRMADANVGTVIRRGIAAAVIAGGVCIGLYFVLYLLSGFDPIATYHVLARVQSSELIPLKRPFPLHILWDLYDFALGSGWISILLVIFYFARRGSITARGPAARLAQLATLQILVVAAAALLPGETARLWMPLLPLLVVPIGMELARWRARDRMIAYACLWLSLAILAQNITFIYMGMELDGPRWPFQYQQLQHQSS